MEKDSLILTVYSHTALRCAGYVARLLMVVKNNGHYSALQDCEICAIMIKRIVRSGSSALGIMQSAAAAGGGG